MTWPDANSPIWSLAHMALVALVAVVMLSMAGSVTDGDEIRDILLIVAGVSGIEIARRKLGNGKNGK